MTSDDQQFALGVISGKIDLVLVQLASDRVLSAEHRAKVDAELTSQGEDIASLKRDRSWVLGAGAAIAALVSATGTYLMGK